jgi:hypothetical protein
MQPSTAESAIVYKPVDMMNKQARSHTEEWT